MNPARPDPTVTRFLVATATLALAGAVAVVFWATRISPDFPFLPNADRGSWITVPEPVRTHAVASPTERPRSVRFVRDVSGIPAAVEIQALRDFELRVNGETVASTPPGDPNWKRPMLVKTSAFGPGSNRIEVTVTNPLGPPLLRLATPGSSPGWSSDTSWRVEQDGQVTRSAKIANDTRPAATSLTAPQAVDLIGLHAGALLAFATLGGLLSILLRRNPLPLSARLGTALAAGAVLALWLAVLLLKTSQLPLYAGFDGPDHLSYVYFVSQNLALPLASDGPAMYHPPLFYIVAAALHRLGGEEPGSLMRLIPFLSGLVQIAIAYVLARRLFPDLRGVATLSLLAAGLLPLNLYMSAYLSNEPLHAALTGCVIWLCVEVLLATGWPARWLLGLGIALGAALLTKVTSLLLLPLLGIFLGAKALLVETGPRRLRQAAGAFVAVALPAVLIAGGFYLRNWIELGRPVIGNWDIPGTAVQWWQYPGFHTLDYFTGFGEAIRRPFFAGFHSFADGLYATFWTDSLVGGVSALAYRHEYWNYEWMTLVAWLALPATVSIAAGVAWLAARALRIAESRRRLALCFLVSTIGVYFFAVFFINLRLPFYAQAKASYALGVIAPIALALAVALFAIQRRLDQPGLRWALVLFHAWAAALVAALVLAVGA